ncbi:MAG: hypothetical protein ACI9J3_002127 [Parvicellaceae bacterium]|jgi:hypothetical protein
MKKLILVFAVIGSVAMVSCSVDTSELDPTDSDNLRIEVPNPDANEPIIDTTVNEDSTDAGIDSTDLVPDEKVVSEVVSTRN